ncbi:MAG: EmrB/QacA family drug resistance transporter [Gammaproteobacteria bacterium]|nr:EmrB/QacA family drug resistance transporter [Gammaproteobacteria bacterium]
MAERGKQPGGDFDGWTPERSAAGDRSPWLIATIISISAFMEVLDTAIANVSLRHIAGATSSSYDEATWVLTSYLIANAIVIPLSSWLSDVVGRKRYYMISVALFTVASLCCGLAPNLPVLILARIVQGIGGGGLQPVTQAMLVDTFPPNKRGQALALYGLTVILAPTIGPVLGGSITDRFSWHWIFLINVPIGAAALLLVQAFVAEPRALQEERKRRLRRGIRLDFTGMALIAVGLGFLELTMDRGQRDDWFSSSLILSSAVIATVALAAFAVWEWFHSEPLLDVKMFKQRNFAVANLVMLIVGVILFGTTQFIPQMLQEVLGYTATSAGLAMTLGGAVTLIAMPVAGLLSNKVQPRVLMGFALVVEALALWNMTHFDINMTLQDAALGRLWQALGIPFLFVPLTNAAYVGLPPSRSSQASAMLNVSRNLGGSIGISLVQTLLETRRQFHQSRFSEILEPLNPSYAAGLDQITQTLKAQGISAVEAGQAALGQIYQAVLEQASMQAFIDCFWVLMIFVACVFPTVFLLKKSPTGDAPREKSSARGRETSRAPHAGVAR